MDERCQFCTGICKQLNRDDAPVRYFFAMLAADEVMDLIERTIRAFSGWRYLHLNQIEQSAGGQLAVLLDVDHALDVERAEGLFVVLVAQANFEPSRKAEICFRYGVPEECCDHPEIAAEVSAIVAQILETLSAADDPDAQTLPVNG